MDNPFSKPPEHIRRVTVYASSSNALAAAYYDAAARLGTVLGRAGLDIVSGKSHLEIRATGGKVDESLLPTLEQFPGVAASTLCASVLAASTRRSPIQAVPQQRAPHRRHLGAHLVRAPRQQQDGGLKRGR